MKHICFVIQRYGLEVNGGAELLCREIAERLQKMYSVDVYTTCAQDYITWRNAYPEKEVDINGVHVYRFRNNKKRDKRYLNSFHNNFSRQIIGNPSKETEWIKKQGPYCPSLLNAIRCNSGKYDTFIFFTYLYYPTVMGLPLVKNKAIFIPTAHDEPYIYMNIMKSIFCECHSIYYMTNVEKSFVNSVFHNELIPSEVGGSGIEISGDVKPERAQEKFGIKNYLVYIGRIDAGKNVPELLSFFCRYKQRYPSDLKLVLIGKKFIKIKDNDNIKALGFVSDEDKYNLIAGAKALILPSHFESLSLVVLEAMKLQVPVIAAAQCEVVRNHCTRSNGGLYYWNYAEFEGILQWMKSHPEETHIMGKNGSKYVEENYTWNKVIGKLCKLIEN